MQCKGGKCDRPAPDFCYGVIGGCQYKSSADVAREFMAKSVEQFDPAYKALANFDTHGHTKRFLGSIPLPVKEANLQVKTEQTMPVSSSERKNVPLCSGVLDYFPAALAAVARLSKYGNDKHNPGQPLHWARGKSMDHADCLLRHLADRGAVDPDSGLSHTVEVAWRALALLQEEEESRGAPRSRGSRDAQ